MVYFTKNKHIYFNDAGETYLSVTTFLKRFKEEFDAEYWLNYKALEAVRNNFIKDPETGKYAKMPGFFKSVVKYPDVSLAVKHQERELFEQTKLELKDQWKTNAETATDFGTSYHKMNEDRDNASGIVLNPTNNTGYFVDPLVDCPEDNCTRLILPNHCYLELLIHSDKHMIAGQSDKVFFINDIDFQIRDFKTNSELKNTSFNNKKMKFPFNTLEDHTVNHYAIQLGLYAYMLELQGYVCTGLFIDHYEKPIEVKYYKEMIEEAMKIREIELSLS